MRRLVLVVLGIVAVGALSVGIGLRIPAVQDRLFAFALSRLTSSSGTPFDDGSLRALFCGTSSPLPHPTRAKACVAVFAGKKFWVVDTGPGSWNSAALARIDGSAVAQLDALAGGKVEEHLEIVLEDASVRSWETFLPARVTIMQRVGEEVIIHTD